jgi:hypothetical protein
MRRYAPRSSRAAGSGGGLRWTALDILQHQRQAQRYGRIGRIGGAGGGLGDLLRDVAPSRSRPAIFRQMSHQLAHVGERPERHDRGDDQRPRQPLRPVRTLMQHGRHGPLLCRWGLTYAFRRMAVEVEAYTRHQAIADDVHGPSADFATQIATGQRGIKRDNTVGG